MLEIRGWTLELFLFFQGECDTHKVSTQLCFFLFLSLSIVIHLLCCFIFFMQCWYANYRVSIELYGQKKKGPLFCHSGKSQTVQRAAHAFIYQQKSRKSQTRHSHSPHFILFYSNLSAGSPEPGHVTIALIDSQLYNNLLYIRYKVFFQNYVKITFSFRDTGCWNMCDVSM